MRHHEAPDYGAAEFCPWLSLGTPEPPRRRGAGVPCGGVLAGPTLSVSTRTPREGEAPIQLHCGAGRSLMPASRRAVHRRGRRTPPRAILPLSRARRACPSVVPPCPRRAVCVSYVARARSTGMSPLGIKLGRPAPVARHSSAWDARPHGGPCPPPCSDLQLPPSSPGASYPSASRDAPSSCVPSNR